MGLWPRFDPSLTQVSVTGLPRTNERVYSRAPNLVSPVARPGSPFIALDMLISNGLDSLPWARVQFPTCAEKILDGFEWNSL